MKKTKIIFSLAGLATVSTVLGPVLTSCSSSSTVVIVFNTNGGTSIQQQRVNKGECATRPTDPTKDGYDFAGWYTDAALTQEFDFATPLQQSITLYAKWSDGQVNAAQWMSAFSYLVSDRTDKNFTVTTKDTSNASYSIYCGTDGASNIYKSSVTYSGSTTVYNTWEEFYGTKIISTTKSGSTGESHFVTSSTINALLSGWFSQYIYDFALARYDASSRSYILSLTTYGNVSIKFDGQARLSSLSYTITGTGNTFTTNVSNYGTTLVNDLPVGSRVILSNEDFVAADKLAASVNFNVYGKPLCFVSFPVSKILNFSSSSYTYVSFGTSSVGFDSSTMYIAVNGTELSSSSYSCTSSSVKIYTDVLSSSSTITMQFNGISSDEAITNLKFYQ